MDQPPHAFYDANRQQIEERAANRSPRPQAEPVSGAIAVCFFALVVAGSALAFAGGPDLSEHRQGGIAGFVSLVAGGIGYFFLRSQHRAFDEAVERETRALWDGNAGRIYRDQTAP